MFPAGGKSSPARLLRAPRPLRLEKYLQTSLTPPPPDRSASPTDRQAPPEFLPQSRRSRLRRHQRNCGSASATLTDRLGSGFATPTWVSPSFALRAVTRAIPLPRGLTSSRSLGFRNPPLILSARRKLWLDKVLGDGSRSAQAPACVLPKQVLECLGEAFWWSPFSKRFLQLLTGTALERLGQGCIRNNPGHLT